MGLHQEVIQAFYGDESACNAVSEPEYEEFESCTVDLVLRMPCSYKFQTAYDLPTFRKHKSLLTGCTDRHFPELFSAVTEMPSLLSTKLTKF